MEAHVNGPAITPRSEVAPGAYYFQNPENLDVVPLELVDVGHELWVSLPGDRFRFTSWAVTQNDALTRTELDIAPGTIAPVFANGKQWMVYARPNGAAIALEAIDTVAPST